MSVSLRSRTAGDPAWQAYLGEFHRQRPGVTDDVLHRATGPGGDAYRWLASAAPTGRILDLACGSAPTARHLTGAEVTGVDVSAAELAIAAGAGVRVNHADAAALPFADGTFDGAVCSMALQVLPWPALQEVRRVVRPGGLLVATVPSSAPLTKGDLLRYARLFLALRITRLGYPNDTQLADAPRALGLAGFDVVNDESCRFALPASAAALLVESFYLPGVMPARVAAAQRVARRWGRGSIGVPVRRLVALRR